MPELAEVEFYRKQWASCSGQEVQRVRYHASARIFREQSAAALDSLKGQRLLQSLAHGKRLLFGFSDRLWLGVHLGMSGALSISEPKEALEKHEHLVMSFDNGEAVFTDPRMFGKVTLDQTASEGLPTWWQELPPSVLGPDFTPHRIAGFSQRFRRTPLKAFLLHQEVFPGIGNWMADEICWRAQLPPQVLAGTLDAEAVRLIWEVSRQVAQDAMRVIGDDWGEPPTSWLFQHRWKSGGFCPRPQCGAALVRQEVRGRTSCWCPLCQQG